MGEELSHKINSASARMRVSSPKCQDLDRLIQFKVLGISTPLLGRNKTEMKSGVFIFDETEKIPDSLHTNTTQFCIDFDEKHFNRTTSIETRTLQALFALLGLMVPWGWVPLGISMAGPALGYLPTGSVAANIFVFSLISIASVAFGNQMANLGKTIGHKVFDDHGFSATKEDKLPHVKPVNYKVQFKLPFSQTIRFFKVPVNPAIVVLSAIYAGFKTVPRSLLFWMAERHFPVYRGFFIGPLVLSMFEESYNDAYLSWKSNFSQSPPSIAMRKEILRERLKDMKKLVNSSKSDTLIDALYDEYQTAKTDNFPSNGTGFISFLLRYSRIFKLIHRCFKSPAERAKAPQSKERVFIASMFFVRKMLNPGIEMQQEEIAQAHSTLQSTTVNIPNELRVILEAGVDPAIHTGLTGWSRYFEDIESMEKRTNARRFIEGNSNYISGVAAIGSFLLILWVADHVFPKYGNQILFSYQGYDLNYRTTIAGVIALFQAAIDPFSEWYSRNSAFLSFRGLFSTHEDFWPIRKCMIALTSFLAGFGTLAYLAILITLPEAPIYIKALPALGLMANQFLLLYAFFHTQYSDVLTKIVTTGTKKAPTMRSTFWKRSLRLPLKAVRALQLSRKRAELNYEIDRLISTLLPEHDELDDLTIEQLYNLTQGGL